MINATPPTDTSKCSLLPAEMLRIHVAVSVCARLRQRGAMAEPLMRATGGYLWHDTALCAQLQSVGAIHGGAQPVPIAALQGSSAAWVSAQAPLWRLPLPRVRHRHPLRTAALWRCACGPILRVYLIKGLGKAHAHSCALISTVSVRGAFPQAAVVRSKP